MQGLNLDLNYAVKRGRARLIHFAAAGCCGGGWRWGWPWKWQLLDCGRWRSCLGSPFLQWELGSCSQTLCPECMYSVSLIYSVDLLIPGNYSQPFLFKETLTLQLCLDEHSGSSYLYATTSSFSSLSSCLNQVPLPSLNIPWSPQLMGLIWSTGKFYVSIMVFVIDCLGFELISLLCSNASSWGSIKLKYT